MSGWKELLESRIKHYRTLQSNATALGNKQSVNSANCKVQVLLEFQRLSSGFALGKVKEIEKEIKFELESSGEGIRLYKLESKLEVWKEIAGNKKEAKKE